jgi:hypothetical protein
MLYNMARGVLIILFPFIKIEFYILKQVSSCKEKLRNK